MNQIFRKLLQTLKGTKVKNENDVFSDEAMDLFCEAYTEGFHKSIKRSFTGKKKDASKYARTMFPELGKALSLSAAYVRSKGTLSPIDHNLMDVAYKLKNKLSRLGLKHEVVLNPPKRKPNQEKSSANKLYQDWVDKNEFVAKDELLAHFYQCINYQAFGSARYLLKQKGYDFLQVDNGWKVIKRPELKKEEKPKETFSSDEIQLMKLLLKKFERM